MMFLGFWWSGGEAGFAAEAAGAVLGGYDYAGSCGFGVPLLTGWLAGANAAKPSQ